MKLKSVLFGIKIKSDPGHEKPEEMFRAFNRLRKQRMNSKQKSALIGLRTLTAQDMNMQVK